MTDPTILRRAASSHRKMAPIAFDAVPSDWATADPPYTLVIEAHPDYPDVPILRYRQAASGGLGSLLIEDGELLVEDGDVITE